MRVHWPDPLLRSAPHGLTSGSPERKAMGASGRSVPLDRSGIDVVARLRRRSILGWGEAQPMSPVHLVEMITWGGLRGS